MGWGGVGWGGVGWGGVGWGGVGWGGVGDHNVDLQVAFSDFPIAYQVRHCRNYLLAAVSLLSFVSLRGFPAFPSFSGGIVF